MAATVTVSVVQSCLDYANALVHGTLPATFISCSVHRTLCLVLLCLIRLSQQQTLTSSLAPGTQADSVQNRPPNIQEFVTQPATIPQKSSSYVPTIVLSPLSHSKSLIYSLRTVLLI